MPTANSSSGAAELLTEAQASNYRRTGSYAEVVTLCEAFAARWPEKVRKLEFGRTPERRPLLALLVSGCGTLDAHEIRRRNIPVLMVQAGIHPGESDGKDAGFIVLRELLTDSTRSAVAAALQKIVLLFVPVLSPDGHERVGPWNRANQNGPEATGWRANAQNLNLNRDYAKLDAPELQALLRLMEQFDPLLCVDLHVANGADFEHDVSIQVEPLHLGAAQLHPLGVAIRDFVIAALSASGSQPLPFYPVLAQQDDPAGGFVDYVFTPRYSTGYWPLRNRFTMLVETHAWKDYGHRVAVTANVIRSLVELAASQGSQWRRAVDAADVAGATLGGSQVTINYSLTDHVETVSFRGYAYTRSPSDISGALMTEYHRGEPQLWLVPLRGDIQPSLSARAPRGGYYIAAGYALDVAPRLTLHGISFQVMHTPLTAVPLESFRAARVDFDSEPNEGRWRAAVSGEWCSETLHIAAGALFVPIAQPRAQLAMALLEPQAPDSFAAWGFFNAAFERKEYLEAYVAEQQARRMLADNPALGVEFARRLVSDAHFAADPAARLDFFYQRHPAWDQRLGLIPVFRSETVPAL